MQIMRHGASLHFLFPRIREQPDLFEDSESAATRDIGTDDDHNLFQGGPPIGLQTLLGLMRPDRPNVAFRAAIGVGIGWLPLAIMTAVQSLVLGDGSFGSFLSDYGVHARSLIAVPLLIGAEAVCLPRLSAIARQFRDAELVDSRDIPAFRHAVATTRDLRDSTRLELALLALAVTIIFAAFFTVPQRIFPPWHGVHIDGREVFSPAGWWHGYVSVWILLVLVLGWLWRLALWARFLFLVSRLKLRLVASHPDRSGGLKFVGISAQAFSVLAFSLSVIMAGTIANRVMHDGVSILSFKYIVLGYTAFILALLAGPLVVFAGQLLETWRRGIFEYGALARGVGLAMERKWLGRAAGDTALDANDFSATTDLYSIVSNVYGMTVVPLSLTNVVVLVVATLLPFAPIVAMSVSPEVILQKLMGMLP
jgi:hypothetical protein